MGRGTIHTLKSYRDLIGALIGQHEDVTFSVLIASTGCL